MKAHSKIFHTQPWVDNSNQFWLASTIQIKRNLTRFPFPEKLDADKKDQIIALTKPHLLAQKFLVQPEFFPIKEVNPIEKEYLVEHFLTSTSFHQTHSGAGFILDQSGRFLVTLNVDNHIQFELIECSGELEGGWNQLAHIERTVGEAVTYAFSNKYGYLTSAPAESGTGFILTVFLQPSALIHTGKIEKTLQQLITPDYLSLGLQGDPHQIIGDIYAIRNHYTTGLTEENIISSIRLLTTKMMVEENNMRNELKNGENPEVMDKVSRAFGTLLHSYQIEPIEALNSISLLKLGAHLGWLEGVAQHDLNALFFNCRRAHLLLNFGKEITLEELPHKRAEFIHKTLKKTKLLI